jgi:hypothetical protein
LFTYVCIWIMTFSLAFMCHLWVTPSHFITKYSLNSCTTIPSGVNFINIKRASFSYECHFSSYALALSKNLYQTRANNVDEIDSWTGFIHYGTQLMPSIGFLSKNWWHWQVCLQNKIICSQMNCNSLRWARCHHW